MNEMANLKPKRWHTHQGQVQNHRLETVSTREVVELLNQQQVEVERLQEEVRITRGDLTPAERHTQDFVDGTFERRQDNA